MHFPSSLLPTDEDPEEPGGLCEHPVHGVYGLLPQVMQPLSPTPHVLQPLGY